MAPLHTFDARISKSDGSTANVAFFTSTIKTTSPPPPTEVVFIPMSSIPDSLWLLRLILYIRKLRIYLSQKNLGAFQGMLADHCAAASVRFVKGRKRRHPDSTQGCPSAYRTEAEIRLPSP
ncbi:uncharacterized protein EV420DRAFT_1477025 [Desarmillaria tabescens]|uniref:Uncharacterized protein n=1 Tax=Armillaria tabescens TaxID=1929756 RepID=A0AA39NAY8_ARMTA|nr:uncharacterized protein EV420DRAFT_1477025 [Desarmillaria tabescens]KAK0462273.1 hypothetical protein EV420DRAFT_1477025 [Desarmillaria tabescens]